MHTYRIITLISAIMAFVSAPGRDGEPRAHPGEVVAILGDSNTWYGGDDCSGDRAWTREWMRLYLPASARSYARSGATWTNTSATRRNTAAYSEVIDDDNTIYNQVERLGEAMASGAQATPTLVIIMAGTNDAWFGRRRPGALDMTPSRAVEAMADSALIDMAPSGVTSMALAIRQAVLRLRRMAPGALIVLAGPLQSVQAPDARIRAAGEIVAGMGRRLGVPALRLDSEFGLDSRQERVKKRLTTDGTHTSPEGAALLGAFMAARIDSIAASRPHTD